MPMGLSLKQMLAPLKYLGKQPGVSLALAGA